MQQLSDRLYSWATDLDEQTINQARRAASLPVVTGHVALMPDAHVGIGATVGSVIPTEGAIIPSAVGVDVGCGMAAIRLDITADHLPNNLDGLLGPIAKAVPAGVGQGHTRTRSAVERWFAANPPPPSVGGDLLRRAENQFGSLGSGNHFFEVCLDEHDRVWLFLHSGSRGVGNILATRHIGRAKSLARHLAESPSDPELGWFLQGTVPFQEYIADMVWSQAYAFANRETMLDAALSTFVKHVRRGREVERINCHHNYAAVERHHVGSETKDLWITRKGAIRAGVGELGLIPGSMGTKSYVVRGLGNPLSWESCSHGAGRRLSRTEAKRRHTAKDLREQMAGRAWQVDQADALIDEIPSAYKDIDVVMANQADLVEVVHTLRQVLNYKGT
jgi:tRNA-splicing ligase RtcB (3'-phosphate/5'-hydroxy nucleic acid ligase)